MREDNLHQFQICRKALILLVLNILPLLTGGSRRPLGDENCEKQFKRIFPSRVAQELTSVKDIAEDQNDEDSRRGIRVSILARKLACIKDLDETPPFPASSRDKYVYCAILRSIARARLLKRRKQIVGQSLQNFVHANNGTLHFSSFSSVEDLPTQLDYQFPTFSRVDEYVMTIQLGSPAQLFTVIVDTGSDLTWVQCEPCQVCFLQSDPYFKPTSSTTFSQVSCNNAQCGNLPVSACEGADYCEYLYQYGDGSYTVGDLASETFTLTSTTGKTSQVQEFVFGCGLFNQGSFDSMNVDGLVGLGQGPLSLPSQLGTTIGNKFSYCFVNQFDDKTISSPMYFGEIAVPSGNGVIYTPILKNKAYPTYYYLGVTGISVGGSLLNIDSTAFAIDDNGNGGTIIDSGTTITQLVTAAYSAIEAVLQALIFYPKISSFSGLPLCYDTSGVLNPEFPKFTFHLEGGNLNLPEKNVFLPMDSATTVCFCMLNSVTELNIIGNWQQQNIQVLYDREKGQFGFKPTTCNEL